MMQFNTTNQPNDDGTRQTNGHSNDSVARSLSLLIASICLSLIYILFSKQCPYACVCVCVIDSLIVRPKGEKNINEMKRINRVTKECLRCYWTTTTTMIQDEIDTIVWMDGQWPIHMMMYYHTIRSSVLILIIWAMASFIINQCGCTDININNNSNNNRQQMATRNVNQYFDSTNYSSIH